MRRSATMVMAGLALSLFAAAPPGSFAQRPIAMPVPGAAGPRFAGAGSTPFGGIPAGGAGYAPFGGGAAGGAGFSPFIGLYGSPNGFNNFGSAAAIASVPSAAYLNFGRIGYTTESPLPVYAPAPPPAFAPLPPATPLTSLLQVRVTADAEVWLEGHKMRSGGAIRHFRSPPLDPAKAYVYEIRARRAIDGQTFEDVRHTPIRAGATVFVDFSQLAALTPAPKAKDKPKDPAASDDTPSTPAPPANSR